NHNLEAMAKQLYDYWFVQFDFPDENGKPYKSSGSKMVWNEKFKRDIPDGWEVAPLNRELEIKSGYAFKSGSYSSEGMFKIITIKNVQDGYLNISTCECIETLPKDIKKWCILQKGDRLISLTGNCGRVCRVTSEDLLLNQRVGVFCCDGLFSEYFYQFLASDEGNHYCVNLANGAAQANLSPIDLCKMELVYPSRETLSLFNKTVKPIIQQYIANEQKIENFTKLRNDLLPLLMNGQVSVNYDLSAFSSVFSQTILSIARLVVAI
ncbi:restriction endonuclease subunit S, partial [Porphyromonas gingivalis]|uniref:restriction endonuclease subunit S n=2 Tax=Porphyromonas gingivalis TaxID=837 RepID=UPI001F228029